MFKTLVLTLGFLGVSLSAQTPLFDSKNWTGLVKNENVTISYCYEDVIITPDSVVTIPMRVVYPNKQIISILIAQVDGNDATFGKIRRLGIMIFNTQGELLATEEKITAWENPDWTSPLLRAFSNFLERKKAELNEERELGLHDDEDDE
jgi:hypothetical protein